MRKDNNRDCTNCQYNKGIDPNNRPDLIAGPCGQQNCWMDLEKNA
jgi:hypothetical protein